MQKFLRLIKNFIIKEPVLAVAALLAFGSVFFVQPSEKYMDYIDFKTLGCLFCLMVSLKGFEREGVLETISSAAAVRLKNARVIAFFLVFMCFFISMVMTNDVALIALIPVTLAILKACGMENQCTFIVVMQTIAANIGSSLTPVGNPQNLYLFTHYDMGLASFLGTMFPMVLAGGIMLAAVCFLIPGKTVKIAETKNANSQSFSEIRKKPTIVYGILFLLSVGAVFGLFEYWIIMIFVVVIVLLTDVKTLAKVDYSLLLTFVVIFVFVGNIARISYVYDFLLEMTQKSTMATGIVTSQVTSNVPAAILLSGFTEESRELLLGVNIGGLGTLIASMASVISYKFYADAYKGQTGKYLKLFMGWNMVFLVVLTVVGMLLV